MAGTGKGFDNAGGLPMTSFLCSGGGHTGKRLYLALGTLPVDPVVDALRVSGLEGKFVAGVSLMEGDSLLVRLSMGGGV